MRAVNLLPASRRTQDGGSRPGSAYVVLGVLGALLVAVVMYVLTANGLTGKQDELATAQAETQAAQQRAAALGSFGDFASIKQTREATVSQLAQARLDWERLVRELSRVLPDDVYVSTLDASAGGAADAAAAAAGATGPTLGLTGCAPSNPDVATLMVRLRKLHRANEVALTSSARGQGEAGECGDGYGFGITVSFDPAPQAAAPEQVPAHLGGGA
ncbi:MAG: PilN domain-containing protein [Thermoleophilaceae bacterium]